MPGLPIAPRTLQLLGGPGVLRAAPVATRGWLTRPNRSFGGVPPLELLGTDGGAELVNDELGRIEFGDLY